MTRNDLQDISGLERDDFEAFAKPIESKQDAPWLKRDKDIHGNDVIVFIDVENHRTRVATPDQVRDGVYYEFLASRAVA